MTLNEPTPEEIVIDAIRARDARIAELKRKLEEEQRDYRKLILCQIYYQTGTNPDKLEEIYGPTIDRILKQKAFL